MFHSNRRCEEGRAVLAACAMALATAVGANGSAVAHETQSLVKLERYCVASWKNAGIRRDDWDDCTQQTLLELLEQVSPDGLPLAIDNAQSDERRELNRAVWRVVQRSRRAPRLAAYDDRGTLPPASPSADESLNHCWNEIAVIGKQVLSPRQWNILEFTRQGWKVSEIARQLDLTPARVSDEKYKAIAKLREALAGSTGEDPQMTQMASASF